MASLTSMIPTQPREHHFALALVASLAIILGSTAARAQIAGGGDLERFHPAPTPWSGLANGSSDLLAPGDWVLGLHLAYSKNPLLLRRDGQRSSSGIANRFGLEVHTAVGIFDWMELALSLPFVLQQDGNDPALWALPARATGDLRIAPRIAVLRQWKHGIGLAITPAITVPMSQARSLAGEGVVRFAPEANVSWRGEEFFLGGAARFIYRGKEAPVDGLALGSEFVLGVSVGRVLSENFDAILELNGGLAFETVSAGTQGNPLEGLLGVRYRAGDWITLQAAGGVGLLSAPGTPDWRALVGVYVGHGRTRPAETCVLHDPAGNQTLRKTGRDSDHDGVDDACDLSPYVKGSPVDGSPEVAKCVASAPVIRAIKAPFQEPVSEGITELKVTAQRKSVVQPIEFNFDSDVLTETSLPLITLMVEEFKKLPDMMVCWVRGHTDGKGTPEYNQELSQRRTESVVREMVKQGIDPKRLYAQGFGLSRPVASNETEEGRQKNRRVEFVFTLPGDVDPGAKQGSTP